MYTRSEWLDRMESHHPIKKGELNEFMELVKFKKKCKEETGRKYTWQNAVFSSTKPETEKKILNKEGQHLKFLERVKLLKIIKRHIICRLIEEEECEYKRYAHELPIIPETTDTNDVDDCFHNFDECQECGRH